jgi:hypothetical protein
MMSEAQRKAIDGLVAEIRADVDRRVKAALLPLEQRVAAAEDELLRMVRKAADERRQK